MSQSPDNSPDNSPEPAPVDPDTLMGKINGLSFFTMFIVSLLIHTALIGATSVGYIQNCVKYQTIYPRRVISSSLCKLHNELFLSVCILVCLW